jgi:hypothetical protein
VLGGVGDHFAGLLGLEMIAFPTMRPEDWDRPEEALEQLLSRGKPGTPVPLMAGANLPTTFYFQTREGAQGVLQILEVIPKTGVKIRYKLAKAAVKPRVN